MSDAERRHEQQLHDEKIYFVFVTVVWALALAVPIYFGIRADLSTSQFSDYARYPAMFFSVVPLLFGLPAGIALWAHTRRLGQSMAHPGVFAVQRRAKRLLAVGSALTVLAVLIALDVL